MNKGILAFIPLIFLSSVVFFFTSCERCSTCPGALKCIGGACGCQTPYTEGLNCDTFVNQKFVGSYTVNESCQSNGIPANGTYTVTMAADYAQGNAVDIYGLGGPNIGSGTFIRGYVVNSTTLTIDNEQAGAATISGQGTFNLAYNTLNMNYTVSTGGSSASCQFTSARY